MFFSKKNYDFFFAHREFETQLKNIKWPCLGTELFHPTKDASNKLALLAEYLFLIKSPAERQNELVAITPSILCPPISKPIQLLLKTFRQRFILILNSIQIYSIFFFFVKQVSVPL